MLEGGCFCGAVRYEIDPGDHLVANCHCSMCRRASGAPFVTWIIVPRTAFRYTRGTPCEFKSSSHAVRTFCTACGTPLTFTTSKRAAKIDITTCSLDDPEAQAPSIAAHAAGKLPWLAATEPEHNPE